MFGLPSWVSYVAVLAVVGGILAGAYGKGYHDARANCREADLKTQIAELQRDLTVAKDAATFAVEAAKQAEADDAKQEKEIADYVAELAKRPNPGCNLDRTDIDRLWGDRR